MIGALIFAGIVAYAILYSGIATLRGTPVGVWDALTGSVPVGGLSTGGAAGIGQGVGGYVAGVKTGPNPMGGSIVGAARAFLGHGYRLGQPPVNGWNAPGALFDCSGLTQAAYAIATGRVIVHNAAQQYAGCVKIAKASASTGDLVFYSISARLDHVGILTGPPGTTVIDSTPSHGGVTEHAGGENERHVIGYGRPRFLVAGADTGGGGGGTGAGGGGNKGHGGGG